MDPLTAAVAVLAAATAALLGALGPAVLRRLPEPEPEPVAESGAVETGADADALAPQVDVPYAVLARAPGLAGRLAVVAALAAAVLAVSLGPGPDVAAYVLAAGVGSWLGYVDLRTHLLPDRLSLPLLAGCTALLGVAALLAGDGGSFLRALAAAAAVGAFFLLLVLVRPGEMGAGDAKLSLVVGLLLGWVGWGAVVAGTFLGFLLGGLVGLALVAGRRVRLRTALPFGPFLLVGGLAGVVVGELLAAAWVAAL